MTIAFGSESTSDGVIADANSRLLDMLGFEPEDVVGPSTVAPGISIDPWLREPWFNRFARKAPCPTWSCRGERAPGASPTRSPWEVGRLGIKTRAERISYTLRKGLTDSGWSEESA